MTWAYVTYFRKDEPVKKYSECDRYDVYFEDGTILDGEREPDGPKSPPGNLPAELPECPYKMNDVDPGFDMLDLLKDEPSLTDEEIANLPKLD